MLVEIWRVKRITVNVIDKLKNEVRDKILDNMNLDDVPNLDTIAEYINELDLESLLNICKFAEVLDWQLVGRTIGTIVEDYSDKDW